MQIPFNSKFLFIFSVVMCSALLFFIPEDSRAACDAADTYDATTVTASVSDDGVLLSWEKIDDSRFSQYVVVASLSDSSPEYSANGFLMKFNNPDTVSYWIDGDVAYSSGDFTSFEKNTTYYFAVSVEYDCGLVKTSNVVSKEFPDLNPPPLITPQISLSTQDDGSIIVSWNEISHEYFEEYRIVISQNNTTPTYPDDGYLVSFTGADSTWYKVDNSTEYQNGDVTYLQKLSSYYFVVVAKYTYNGSDHYVVSSATKVMYNGPSGDATEYTPTPVISKINSGSSGVQLTWEQITDSRLTGYRIMVNKDASPVYPHSGYISEPDTTETTYTVNNSIAYTDGSFGNYLEYGERYYFTVTALYSTGEAKTTQGYAAYYYGPLPPSTPGTYLALQAISTPGGIQLSWNRLMDSRLAGYKVVIAQSDANPVYPDNGYYTEAVGSDGKFSISLSYYVVKGDLQNTDGDFTTLEIGESYYVALAALLSNGSVINSNAVTVTYQGDDGEVSVYDADTGTIPSGNSSNGEAAGTASDEVVVREKQSLSAIDTALINRLKGRILLQVESHGEAWYVDFDTARKYYLKNGLVAFAALRKFGLGITNVDLSKIPVGIESRFTDTDSDGDQLPDKLEEGLGTNPTIADSDGDGFADGTEILSGYSPLGTDRLQYNTSLVNRLKGRIVLQIQSRGEAWYINPADGKRYYLKDGEAAYNIMRFLSLGITNTDLRKITVGDL